MTPATWRTKSWLRLLAGLLIIAWVTHRVGVAPYAAGLQALGPAPVLAAVLITVFTTTCCALRWSLIAAGMGIRLPLDAAITAYYQSQFLDSTLPGGILGEVYRGVSYGHAAQDMPRGLASVFWERVTGQLVQLTLALALLTALPSPVQRMAWLVAAIAGLAGALVMTLPALRKALRRLLPGGRLPTHHVPAGHGEFSQPTRRALLISLRQYSTHQWLGIVLTSGGAVGGYVTLFLVAAYATGTSATPAQLVPLVLLVLVAAAIPANIAGFGPREGAAAWAFEAAGLGAGQGVAASIAYGILTLLATTPGAALLLHDWLRRR